MSSAATRKVEYVLFDLDGLMIDSEKIYTDVTSPSCDHIVDHGCRLWLPDEILAAFGKEMTWDMKAGCMGKPERPAAEHLLSFFPDIDLPLEEYLRQRNVLQDQRWPTVPLLPGVKKLVYHLKKHNIPIAVATGSRRRNYELKTGHLGEVFDLFDGKIVCADDKQWVMKGKPEPDIFLTAAREMLGRDVGRPREDVTPSQLAERAKGLVFEDALPGMQLLNVEYTGEERPDQQLKSLEEFVPEAWGLPPYSS
ncbi:hypothetical protein VNI00_008508 [Paramarasmius palmivorus]|uniref:Uncharacterized protein n=1 Tax=Paramarasmius palmivorus TaxID=297713 RepID=A0AAW0CY49_9AGAR